MKQVSNIEAPSAAGGATRLQTVDRAFQLLEFVATVDGPTVKRAAEVLDWKLATTYHQLNTLLDRGYVVRDAGGRLRVGPKVAFLHASLVRHLDLGRDLHPLLERLSRETEETAYLAVWRDGEVELQGIVEAPQTLRVAGLYVGFRGEAHSRGSGKAVLAFLPEADREAYLADESLTPRTAATITDARVLRRGLEETVTRGYAVDREEFAEGVGCVAAPLFGSTSDVLGAVTVSAPIQRMDAKFDDLVAAVVWAGREGSRILGYGGDYPPRVT